MTHPVAPQRPATNDPFPIASFDIHSNKRLRKLSGAIQILPKPHILERPSQAGRCRQCPRDPDAPKPPQAQRQSQSKTEHEGRWTQSVFMPPTRSRRLSQSKTPFRQHRRCPQFPSRQRSAALAMDLMDDARRPGTSHAVAGAARCFAVTPARAIRRGLHLFDTGISNRRSQAESAATMSPESDVSKSTFPIDDRKRRFFDPMTKRGHFQVDISNRPSQAIDRLQQFVAHIRFPSRHFQSTITRSLCSGIRFSGHRVSKSTFPIDHHKFHV